MKILFLCTANSCRSILAEAIFNHLAPADMRAYSAGSKPCGQVHGHSLEALRRAGIDPHGLHSKSQTVHEKLQPDLLITLCDNAAAEPCPAYFDGVLKVHWGLPDPAAQGGPQADIDMAFDKTVTDIERRVGEFLSLPLPHLSSQELSGALEAIGKR